MIKMIISNNGCMAVEVTEKNSQSTNHSNPLITSVSKSELSSHKKIPILCTNEFPREIGGILKPPDEIIIKGYKGTLKDKMLEQAIKESGFAKAYCTSEDAKKTLLAYYALNNCITVVELMCETLIITRNTDFLKQYDCSGKLSLTQNLYPFTQEDMLYAECFKISNSALHKPKIEKINFDLTQPYVMYPFFAMKEWTDALNKNLAFDVSRIRFINHHNQPDTVISTLNSNIFDNINLELSLLDSFKQARNIYSYSNKISVLSIQSVIPRFIEIPLINIMDLHYFGHS